jgi:phosphatidylethanolamine/phosphatidyl-N-methylethanolamine N-methyltransferase
MSRATKVPASPQRLEIGRLFYAAWLRDPRRTGAIAPSSRWLARLMTRAITPACVPVLELGPGTGVFTRSLLARGIPENQLTLVEYDSQFAKALQRRFPEARILCLNAARLGKVTLFDGPGAGAAISGLPLLALSYRDVLSILEGAFNHLRPTAALYQFTYGARCPVPPPILARLGLKTSLVGRTFANLPPARVYRIRRRGTRAWEPAPAPFGQTISGSGGISQ